jgi:hypothetical protein
MMRDEPDRERRGRVAGERRPDANLDPVLELLSVWLDALLRIPGTQWRVGLDAVVGLIPGVGDALTTVASFYILAAGVRYGVPRVTMLRMALNVAIDCVVGAIPLAGDLFDVAWKANRRNVELLRRHRPGAAPARRGQFGDWLFIGLVMSCLVVLLVGSITIAWYVVGHLFRATPPAAG